MSDHSRAEAELGGERGEYEEGVSPGADGWRSHQGEVSPGAANSSSTNPATEIRAIENVVDNNILRWELQQIQALNNVYLHCHGQVCVLVYKLADSHEKR